MKLLSFVRLFGKSRLGGANARARSRQSRLSSRRRARSGLRLEALEDRTVMSNLPFPIVTAHTNITPNFGPDVVDHSTPTVVYDPTDPGHGKMVAVWTTHDLTVNPNFVGVEGAYSTNGGTTWVW